MKFWRIPLVALLLVVLTMFVSIGVGNKTANADSSFSLELNEECENLPESFWINLREANDITTHFFAHLCSTYGSTVDDSVYTVNGILAENYPPYFGGTYINTEGRLVVQIVDMYYSENYKDSAWYQEFVGIVGSENFYCHPVKYSYAELINAISAVSLGTLSESFSAIGVVNYEAGINDYSNVVSVTFGSQADYDSSIDLLNSDIYTASVVEYTAQFNIGVYPGEGISKTSTGGYGFSVACRVRRHFPGGTYEDGFLTCAHAFTGNSNVYLYTGASNNTLVGYSYASNQVLGGKADVAYVAANSNATLYDSVYGYTITLNPAYPSSMGSPIYKCGAASQETYGIILNSSDSQIIQGVTLSDIVKVAYYSTGGDSGGIVHTKPDAANQADIVGIHSAYAVNASTGAFLWSWFTKITNDLAALQSGPIYYTLY